jgi:pimeloyl-ACP methyl ester carboxylesterase
VKLTYLDLPGEGIASVVLHREAASPVHDVEVLRATGVVGRTVAPFGDYAFYPSGMAIGGLCWYRLLPGFAGTDPISLAKALVQVCDLLDALALADPVLAGFGQGAVVALGAGSLRPDRVGSVVAVDPHPAHLGLLPPAVWESRATPPILLAASSPEGGGALEASSAQLAERGRTAASWCWDGAGGAEAADPDLSEAVRCWLAGEGQG